MSRVVNPEYKPHSELGKTQAEWDALKAQLRTYLQANASEADVATDDLRALNLEFSNDALWLQISGELGLVEIPGS